MRGRTACVLVVLVLLALERWARADGWSGGIGVLGDSYSDEYQFYPPDQVTARNWVELLAALRGLDFGPYRAAAGWGEPRNLGFAYNWARHAATSDDLIAQGQHTGVAAQVARGQVNLVVIFIGGNDFLRALRADDPLAALPAAGRRAAANLDEAVRTIRTAGPEARLVLVTLPDIRDLPEIADARAAGRFRSSWLDAATAAIRDYNGHIRRLAAAREGRIALADLDNSTRVTKLLTPRYLPVGPRLLERTGGGNDLDHVFLADRRHLGTLTQGLLARVLVATINARLGGAIRPLGDREILDFAARLQEGSSRLARVPAAGGPVPMAP